MYKNPIELDFNKNGKWLVLISNFGKFGNKEIYAIFPSEIVVNIRILDNSQ